MQSNEKRYDTLDKHRCEYFVEKFERDMQGVKIIQEDHKKSEIFVDNLVSGKLEEIKKYLYEENKYPFSIKDSTIKRTLVLMDATGSMGGLI